MNDEALLRRASRGDETAFLVLYERHRAAIFRFACRLLGHAQAAEDVTHDCFMSLMKNPERFDPNRASLRTYLLAAARNMSVSQVRREAKAPEAPEPPQASWAPPSEDPLRILLDHELSDRVRDAIAALPPLQREAVILSEYEELSLAEIAAVVDGDVGTVKSRLHRAREQLRRALAAYLRPIATQSSWRSGKHER